MRRMMIGSDYLDFYQGELYQFTITKINKLTVKANMERVNKFGRLASGPVQTATVSLPHVQMCMDHPLQIVFPK